MTSAADSLRNWLRAEVQTVLGRKGSPPPLVLWCDPERAWRPLLQAAADGGTFELWADEDHEFAVRQRLWETRPAPRVVWVPLARGALGYLKPFELTAALVWSESLPSALVRYGVPLSPELEAALRQELPGYAQERIDQPRAAWAELTPGNAKAALVDEDLVLTALARAHVPLAELMPPERASLFRRRVTEDFGLPSPKAGKDDEWRLAATAALLTTEAAVRVPADAPGDKSRIIAPGPARDRALKLLGRWTKDIDLMSGFEELAREADELTGLAAWARHQTGAPPPLGSRAAEEALLLREVHALEPLTQFEELAQRLSDRSQFFAAHADGFWGGHAVERVPWRCLAGLAAAAASLRSESGAEKAWKSARAAVDWYVSGGWHVDQEGEALFADDASFPDSLCRVRNGLRRGYLRFLDDQNAVFSELLDHEGVEKLGLELAGQVVGKHRPAKDPVAVLVLDACRFDLGARLAELLNEGRPQRHVEVLPARAPLPSITRLGMACALVEDPALLAVKVTADGTWHATVGGTHDLSAAEPRREWLRVQHRLKPRGIVPLQEVLDRAPGSPKESGRLLFVLDGSIDTQGHDGELKLAGAADQLERYARAVRRLRDAGFTTVLIVTDHGFIHWKPDDDEVVPAPTGEVRWKCRRAAVGHGLQHATAIRTRVECSDLECLVPRGVGAFKAHGPVGFLHGGATLQELVIPVVVCRWPKKTAKVRVILRPITEITSLRPRVEVVPGAGGLPGMPGPADLMGCQVRVQIVLPGTQQRMFACHEPMTVTPASPAQTVTLALEPGVTCPRGTRLRVEVLDADSDDVLDHREVELKVDLEEWD